MDESNAKSKEDVDIGIPVVPLVLGGMLTTAPILGTGILPFIEANLFVGKAEAKSIDNDEEEEDQLKR